MIIYRVEDKLERGPYRNCLDSFHLNSFLDHAATPLPEEDGLGRDDWDQCKFGFASLEQLTEWFGPELDFLNGRGYGIGVYEVPMSDVFVGRSQVVFDEIFPQISFHKFSEKLDMNLVNA